MHSPIHWDIIINLGIASAFAVVFAMAVYLNWRYPCK